MNKENTTPTPWQWVRLMTDDDKTQMSRDEMIAICAKAINGSDGKEMHGVFATDEEGQCVICYTGNGKRSKWNAELIVKAVNAYVNPKPEPCKGCGELAKALRPFADKAHVPRKDNCNFCGGTYPCEGAVAREAIKAHEARQAEGGEGKG